MACAQTDQGLLLNPWDEGVSCELEATLAWTPRAPARNGGRATSLTTTDASARLSLAQDADLRPAVGFEYHRLDLGTPPPGVPKALTDASVAAALPVGMMDDWFIALQAGAGYAAEASFADGAGWYGKAAMTIGTDLGDGRSIAFWIDYDGNRTLFPDLPLPGAAYSVETESISWTLGFPQSSISWTPTPGLRAAASFELPLSLNASLAFDLDADWSLAAKYARRSTAFHTEGLRSADRLFFDEDTISFSVRRAWPGRLAGGLEVGVGWGFGRELAAGFDERNTRVLQRFGSSMSLHISADFGF